MKKITLSLTMILAVALTVNVSAQERKSGIRAGYVMSNILPSAPGSISGFYAGFAHDNPIGNSKILYIHGGTEYTQAGYQILDDTYRRLHYISLPSGLKVKLGPVFVQGGFAFNFKVAEKYMVDGQDAKTDDNKYKVFNFPVHGSAGLMLGPVTIEARYNYGLSKLNKTLDPDSRLSYIQLGAGFAF